MTDYPTREYIIRETTYPDATKQEAIGELVRCKDCMHYGFTDNRIPEEQVWWCYFWDDVRSPDAYCSDGERKDGNDHEP